MNFNVLFQFIFNLFLFISQFLFSNIFIICPYFQAYYRLMQQKVKGPAYKNPFSFFFDRLNHVVEPKMPDQDFPG